LEKQLIEFMNQMGMKRKKHHSIYMLSLILIFLISCSNAPQREMKEVILWKSDSLGCEKIRTKEMAEKIIDSLKLSEVNESEFLKYFGNPNTRVNREENIVLGFYFDALCRDNKLIDSADYCIAEFTFKGKKLIQRNYVCQ